ncbi:hypothetical protein [Antarctobacter sp.]|uniref:hypothetical protein n=1 Tax=Antarctobacter sp. TaxID=1872577 RepID=UPI002B26F435|nr:hypothetical protein [Antarctobacter sp.]
MYHQSHPILPDMTNAGHPVRGDVVLFRFPVTEEDAEPGAPKRRPCLVLDTFESGGERYVELAYGTSVSTRANRGYEVMVKQPASRAVAGLNKPTRFIGARRITVHIDNSGFNGPTDGPTIIGRLDEALLNRMNAVRARIHAEADIAAHDREERRRAKQARKDRGFR